MSTKPSAQLELCHAYAHAIATFDLDALRTLCAPDITVSFLLKSFGAPIIKGIDKFLGAMTHVMGYGITEVKWEIDEDEIMESEGRVWFFVDFTGKNRLGEAFHNQMIVRTRIGKGGDDKLRFTEIIEYLDPEVEKVLMKGVQSAAAE